MPGIFKLIRDDHDEGRDLMDDIVETENAEARLKLFKELKTAILAHAKAEEKTFYEALKDGENEELAERVQYFKEDHKTVERLFDEIDQIDDPHDYTWWEKFGELKMALEHHMDEEEKQVFPKAKKEIDSEESSELGDEMEMREEKQKAKMMEVA